MPGNCLSIVGMPSLVNAYAIAMVTMGVSVNCVAFEGKLALFFLFFVWKLLLGTGAELSCTGIAPA